MPKKKKGVGARALRGKNGPNGNGSYNTSSLRQANSIRHLSLQEEARNTERHQSGNSGLNLRHAQVKFVSASQNGSAEPADIRDNYSRTLVHRNDHGKVAQEFDRETSMADLSIKPLIETRASSVPLNESKNSTASSYLIDEQTMDQVDMDRDDDESNVFVIDTKGFTKDLRIETELPPPVVLQSSSSDGSDSSEEVIVFGGRDRSQQRHSNEQIRSPYANIPLNYASQIPIRQTKPFPYTSSGLSPKNNLNSSPSLLGEPRTQNDPTIETIVPIRKATKNKPVPEPSLSGVKRSTGSERKQHEDEMLADYVKNVREHEAVENALIEDPVNESITKFSDTEIWEDEEIPHSCDENHKASFKNKSRPHRASDQVLAFEASTKLSKQSLFNDGDSDDSSDLDEQAAIYLEGELDDILDEEDSAERRKHRMTDEQIARLLSKQEELGLGSDELMLFDGDEDTEDTEGDELEIPSSKAFLLSLAAKKKRKKRQKGVTSSASFAGLLDQDLYGGFDVMDRERLSIRKKSKGRNGVADFGLSDSDMEIEVCSAWEKDRLKKRAYKQERADLRAQGLLGKKGKLDIKAKYPEGMSIVSIKQEIRDFLISDTESVLSLTPMDKRERIVVHEIANVFNLKSKSVGGGRSRYPVLYKTSRTVEFSQDAVGEIEARLTHNHFLPRMDKRLREGTKAPKEAFKRRGGGASGAAVSYRDGEIVGASAPELGSENRGRAMLEKMGWSTGTALGALNNKGIMQPVVHVVKTTKAGLG